MSYQINLSCRKTKVDKKIRNYHRFSPKRETERGSLRQQVVLENDVKIANQ